MRALYLAIDGGNSKTDVVLGGSDGSVLAYVRGGTSSPHNIGLDGAVTVLDSLVRAAYEQAGLRFGTPVSLTAAYLAGADLPHEVAELHDALAAAGWGRRTIVDNDCFALLRSGTSMPDAVTVVCGAGTNCVGRAADGRTARFVALGPISGDWGGGHDLSDQALHLAARGEDGRGEATALSAAVAAHFDRRTVEEVSIAIHLGEIPRSRIPSLSQVLFAVASSGDQVAAALIARQAGEILAQHRVAAARLSLLDQPHALVLGGSVLRAQHPVLHRLVVAGARRQAPKVEIAVPHVPPVTGAALLALDALGHTDSETELRAALATTRSFPYEV